jgi:PAS domain S-box-containing protein
MSELIDNRAHRVRTLKEIIKHLHAGGSPEEVRGRLRELVRQTDYSEIVAMEQELMAEGMPVEEIQSMCDLHSQVTRDVLVQLPARSFPPGHPVDTFRRENQALREVIARMRGIMAELEALPDEADARPLVLRWRQAVNELQDIDKHYQRKEHAFFSRLERHGITGPSKVMWAKDDEVRQLLKSLAGALEQENATAGEWKIVAATVAASALAAIEEMFYKEENIFLPLCQDTFTEEDWAEIWLASPRYGWCLVEPRDGYRPPETVVREGLRLPFSEGIQLPTGNLTLEQLTAIFGTLPVDLTFVDADDRVAFYSEGPRRIFARSKAVIGRKVQHCHPPRSVAVVDRILTDFREGRHDVAEFWIDFHGRFVHIRYFAVRDRQGRYLGTLEVTQDITEIRKLEGERRLLQYDEAPVGSAG